MSSSTFFHLLCPLSRFSLTKTTSLHSVILEDIRNLLSSCWKLTTVSILLKNKKCSLKVTKPSLWWLISEAIPVTYHWKTTFRWGFCPYWEKMRKNLRALAFLKKSHLHWVLGKWSSRKFLIIHLKTCLLYTGGQCHHSKELCKQGEHIC